MQKFKVWTDYRRFHSRKAFKSQQKFPKPIKQEPEHSKEEPYRADGEEEDITQTGFRSTASGNNKATHFLHSESEEYEQSYESMHSTLSNDFADEYSYPDRLSHSLQGTQETLVPDGTPYDSLNYSQDDNDEEEQQQQQQQQPQQLHQRSSTHATNADRSPPPLQPGNTRLIDQTLYTLQNQIEQQSKLLEHLSQISSTMANLMERQVNAIEKQTEAIRRQASATEHHTLVMNNFVEMIREKMPRVNSKTNLSNGTL